MKIIQNNLVIKNEIFNAINRELRIYLSENNALNRYIDNLYLGYNKINPDILFFDSFDSSQDFLDALGTYSLDEMISWHSTPEGFDYWENLSFDI